MKGPLLLLILLGVSVLSAQIRWDKLTPVAEDDLPMPALKEWQQKISGDYTKSGVAEAHFSSWYELKFPSLEKLFPDLRFFAVSWMERPVPGKEKQAIGLGGGSYTLVCTRAEGKLINEIYHHGNYEPFGELLASKKISIRSSEDAKLVWEAFCDLHQMHWKENPAIKISDTIWHLGDNTIDGVHYYYEVVLDESRTVTSAKLHADNPARIK